MRVIFLWSFAVIILLHIHSSFTLSERNWVNAKQTSFGFCNFFQYSVNSEYVIMIFITTWIRENSYASVRTGVGGLHKSNESLTILLFFCLLFFLCFLLVPGFFTVLIETRSS